MMLLKITLIIAATLIWNVVWNFFKPARMLQLKLLKKNNKLLLFYLALNKLFLLVFSFWMGKRKYCSFHNKSNKQYTTNYHRVSLLPVCGKIFQKRFLNEMCNYFSTNEFISKNQTGSQPVDSCINLLL